MFVCSYNQFYRLVAHITQRRTSAGEELVVFLAFSVLEPVNLGHGEPPEVAHAHDCLALGGSSRTCRISNMRIIRTFYLREKE